MDERLAPGKHLHYNAYNNRFLLLNDECHDLFVGCECAEIEARSPLFYQKMVDNEFVVPDDFDEAEVIKYVKNRMQHDSTWYHVMINTTLDCNLNCWYCYESRIAGSYLKEDVVEAIKKNIKLEYTRARFNTLKVSFFGGEPFFYFKGIKDVLSFAEEFCKENDVEIIADFTTNATLITQEQIDFIKKYRCHFQITLDGDRAVHNSIKKDPSKPSADTYQQTIDVLRMINAEIPNRWVAVRVNFDNRTLKKIDEIIADIDFLDRKKGYVILKKVWQIPKDKVDVALLHEAVQKFFDKKFLLDYYIMPKGHVCFAERHREVLFNYDGKIFKCSTISSFDEDNALGKLDFETGHVQWHPTPIAYWQKYLLPKDCIECKWFPACLGPCNKQLLAHKDEKIGTFDAINMDTKEFLMYSLKYHLLQNELLDIPT
ncbi:MAG: radical SAM protein [Tannerellaceae bacterium]|nr:radical SAM protein [Tannerellaceae bacterium]